MNNEIKNSKIGLIIFSVASVVISLVVSGCLWIGFSGKSGLSSNKIDVFEYVYPFAAGVDGSASITIMLDQYEIDDDSSMSKSEKTDLKEYIRSLEFQAEGKKLTTFDFDLLSDEEETVEKEEELFDVSNGDSIEITVNETSSSKGFSLLKTQDKLKISSLGKLITSIDQVSSDMLVELEKDAKEYLTLGFSFKNNYDEAEKAIKSGEAKKVGIYYRMDDYKKVSYDFYKEPFPYALTISFAYEYEGQIYLVTKTGLTIASYSFSGDTLSYGDTIYFEDFDFSTEESNAQNIKASMDKKGYKLLAQ